MSALKLAVDGRALGDASAYRGLGSYLRLLLSGLAAEPEVEVTALVRAGTPLPAGIGRMTVVRRAPDRWATAEHHLRLPIELARLGSDVDVVHSPALDPPRRVRPPWVQTIPDVLALADPSPALAVERRRWRRWAERVRRAAAVIALSRHSADQAIEHLGLDPTRVHVVHLAADPRYVPPPTPPVPADPAYLLSVSEYGPHKNLSSLAHLMAGLVESRLPHRLVLAGRVAPAHRALIDRELGAAGPAARRRIDVLGWVPDLLPLYRGASALVVTSRHEGFGLPAVEAMATATPVVAFANSATIEVVASGGILVPDGDERAMARAVLDLLTDPARHREARSLALERSRAFAWSDTVRRHVDIYRGIGRG